MSFDIDYTKEEKLLNNYINENFTEEEQERMEFYINPQDFIYHFVLDEQEYLLICDDSFKVNCYLVLKKR